MTPSKNIFDTPLLQNYDLEGRRPNFIAHLDYLFDNRGWLTDWSTCLLVGFTLPDPLPVDTTTTATQGSVTGQLQGARQKYQHQMKT